MTDLQLRVAGVVAGVGFLAAILLPAAGRLDLPTIWVYLGVTAALSTIGMAHMDPGLIRERFKPGPGDWDAAVVLLGPMYLAHLIVAGIDLGRFHWSDTVPLPLIVVGFFALVAGTAVTLWGMNANPYFSPKIRLQPDRGQHVIDIGPYAHVRHPGYAGAIVLFLGSGLALGSWLSLIPAFGAIIGILWRTVVEDRFLRAQLPGYADYATRVKYRLVPGIW